jgi:hypothetical protein
MPRHEYRSTVIVDEQAHSHGAPAVGGPAPYPSLSAARTAPGLGGGRGRTGRLLLALLALVALVAPYALGVGLFWSRAGDDLRSSETERVGVSYLRPLVRLLAVAAYQESLDIAGTPGDGQRLRLAIRDVDSVDATVGGVLGVHDRWVDVHRRLQSLLDGPPRAGVAAEQFGPVVDLVVALVSAVGDRSALILDPNLDTYYLMDAALVRLPAVLVDSSRLSDAGRAAPAVRAVRTAVFADRIRSESEALDTSMRKSFAATQTNAMTAGLIFRLDRFGDAVTTLAPPTAGLGGTTSSAGSLIDSRDQVREAGLELEDVTLTHLDTLLAARIGKATDQRRLVLGVALAGFLLAGLAGWPLPGRSRRASPGAVHGGPGARPDLLKPLRPGATGRGGR